MFGVDITLVEALTFVCFGFIGSLIGGITSIFKGSSSKKAAKIAAENAAKDRALQRELAQRQEKAAQKKQDWIMKIAMIGGGVILLVVIVFIFKKKR